MSVKRKKPDIATDHRNGSHMEEWAWQWDQKLMPVGRFIDAVERGESPALDDARSVAMALRAFFCLTMTPARYFAGLRRSSMKQVYQGLTRVHHMPVLSET